jgi:hypothetical protein
MEKDENFTPVVDCLSSAEFLATIRLNGGWHFGYLDEDV